MQQTSTARVSLYAIFMRSKWLIFFLLFWPALASAAAASSLCPTDLAVASRRSVTTADLTACEQTFTSGTLPAKLNSTNVTTGTGPINQAPELQWRAGGPGAPYLTDQFQSFGLRLISGNAASSIAFNVRDDALPSALVDLRVQHNFAGNNNVVSFGTPGDEGWVRLFSNGFTASAPIGSINQIMSSLALDIRSAPSSISFQITVSINDKGSTGRCSETVAAPCDKFGWATIEVNAGPLTPTSLSIDDVTIDRVDSGSTDALFTVSLSSPAGPNGVTFNIATADGTATAPLDYVARSLTNQTIAAGGSTYTFAVPVNGNTAAGPSKTFFVNVTPVIGAVVANGQGVGTIIDSFDHLFANGFDWSQVRWLVR